MLSLHDALLGLGAPALLGVVIYWLVRRRKPTASVHAPASLANAGSATGLALCFGFTIGYCGVHSLPKLPPSEALEWLVLAAAGMFFLMVLDQYLWRSSRFVLGSQLAIIVAAISLIVWLIAKNGWPIGQTIGWIVGSCAVAGVLLLGLKPACKHNLPIAVTVSLTALTMFAAGVLGMSGSQTYGLQAATMPAVLVPLAILSIWRRATLFTPTCLPAFVLLYGGMLLCGYLYINLTTVNALLLVAAPLGLLAGLLPAAGKLDDWQRAAIPMLAAIIPGAIAFGLALHQFLIDMSNSLPF
jgi:hypothetical protein